MRLVVDPSSHLPCHFTMICIFPTVVVVFDSVRFRVLRLSQRYKIKSVQDCHCFPFRVLLDPLPDLLDGISLRYPAGGIAPDKHVAQIR